MENIIIGSGPAGRLSSLELGKLGKEVLLIEKKHIAGTCLNEGCMVICALNDISRFLNAQKRFEDLGFIKGDLKFSYTKATQEIKKTQEMLRKLEQEENESVGNTIIYGEAKIEGDSIIVNKESYNYNNLLIATGSRTNIPKIKGSEHGLTNKDILNIKKVPKELNIIGGGIEGAEIANIFHSFGSKVNIFARSSFLKDLDSTIKDYVMKKLLNRINIFENTNVSEIKKDKIIANDTEYNGIPFIATGRVPNSEIAKDIVQLNNDNSIKVNDLMQTNKKNIYAAGDVTGRINLTPIARMEGVTAARNMAGYSQKIEYKNIPQSLTLDLDVSYTKNRSNTETEKESIIIPGLGGPGSFWRILNSQTGITKIDINKKSRNIENVSSISPSAVDNVSYMTFLMNMGVDMNNFNEFIEIHPSTDAISKIMKYMY